MADNWAAHNPGVILVFCIIGAVALGIIFFQVYPLCTVLISGSKSDGSTKEAS
jgi:hypothetical protein